MNLDELISKYLDGELSNSEDKELRRLLSEDDVAKQSFDAHVLIHAAMKEDASSILPSKELIGRTEDRVLSKILSDKEEEYKPVMVPFFFRRRAFAFGGALAVLLLISVIIISNLNWSFYGNDLDDALENERQRIMTQSNLELLGLSESEMSSPYEMNIAVPDEILTDVSAERMVSKFGVSRVNASISSKKDNQISSANAMSVDLNISSKVNSSYDLAPRTESGQNKNNEMVTLDDRSGLVTNNNTDIEKFVRRNDVSGIQKLSEGTNPSLMVSVPIISNSEKDASSDEPEDSDEQMVPKDEFTNMKQMNFIMSNDVLTTRDLLGQFNGSDRFYGAKSDIRLTTFFGSEIKQFGFEAENPSVISSYSQSISYNVSDASKFGIDFGYTDYSFIETRIARVPNPSFHSTDEVNGDAYQSRIEVRRDGDPMRYIEFPFEMNIKRQIVWGSGFFEHSIIDNRIFGLNGRLSLGATNDGLISMARLFGRVKLFDWLAISAGSEARLFRWDNPAIGTGKSGYKSTISLIYGFEIKL